MAVRLVVAPAGSGKTAYAIEAIRALPPLTPVRVLVPDQLDVEAFRQRMAQAGGTFGVRVQTFYGLYADILARAWGTLELPQAQPEQGMAYLMPAVRQRLILHIAGSLYDAGKLPYYAPVRHSPGFARLLGDLFGEFKRARVFPEDLSRIVSSPPSSGGIEGGNRLIELATLYAAYQHWLLETGWIDAEGQGWLAAIALEQTPSLLSDLALMVVDGFDEFNPTQLHLLQLLAGRAAATLVTMTGDLQRPDRLAHRRLIRARTVLVETFDVETVSIPRKKQATALTHLEAGLFEPGVAPHPTGDAVVFLEAQNRASEAREALRWLKARLVHDRLSPSDVAIIARNVIAYRLFLEEVAAEFGMPLHFASGDSLQSNPAVAAILNLLRLPLEPDPWSPRALIDALTSPYLNWSGCGLERGDAERLYDVANAGQVVARLDQWHEAFQRLAARKEAQDGAPARDYEEDDPSSHRPPSRVEAARLEAVVQAVVARITPPPRATLRERVMWVEVLIGDDPVEAGQDADDVASMHVVACARANPATAERDVAALQTFKDILRAQVLADGMLGGQEGEPLAYDQFVAGLVQAVQEASLDVSGEREAILVASVPEARGLAFDSVALLGLSEGDFPSVERQDPLLREPDRAWLAEQGFAIEPRLRGDEATFFYQAVTRARRRLLLCRPYLADDGQPWEPSPYWSAVLGLFDEAQVQHIRPVDPVSDVASEQELADMLPGDEIEDMVAILHVRSRAAHSLWNGDLSSLEGRLAERFGPDRPWSSSRLETFAKCPFYFWAAFVMELEPRDLPRIGFDVLILGSIYHLVLERLYDLVADGDPDRLRAELPAVAQRVYDAAPNEYGFRPTPLWERQQEELTDVLRRTVEALIEIAGPYKPLRQELPFGLHEQPPLVLSSSKNPALSMLLRGYIDRVDRAPDGRLRIIDYKAGSTPISARDLSDGHRLQLPLYAMAAQEALRAPVASGFYWHIGSAGPSSLRLEKYAPAGGKAGVAGAIETAVDYAMAIGAAVRAGHFMPAPPEGGCPHFCPAASFCEWYQPRSW
ncbi:MAG: PD-(D/E)XK nuclease family protein [Anaerolineae bacterium]|nr:PD-(D/E)XK nuclease family protein [Anaerolineae bacterium]